MASTQRTVPAAGSTVVQLPVQRGVEPWSHACAVSVRAGVARPAPGVARGPQSATPAPVRRDPVRPGGRPPRTDAVAGARPVRGGCSPEPVVRTPAGLRPARQDGVPAPLRLTRRGRRVLSGLSIAIGLSIAVATVGVELAHSDGLQLAGSSTVVVQNGDTLWSLAGDVAPDEDRRAVVDAIVDINGLHDVDLVPGMVLELP
jgi:hypothetical protein